MTADRAWHRTLECGCQVNPESGAMLQQCERHRTGDFKGYEPERLLPEWLTRWMSGEQMGASSGIAAEEPTYGYGDLGAHGYFAVPVPDAFVAQLDAAYTARQAREATRDNGPGTLEVGTDGRGQVVVNLPRDMTGHIVFSVQQAHDFAHLVVRKALEAAGAPEGAADLEVTFPAETDGNIFVFCDRTWRSDVGVHYGCVRGAGHSPPCAFAPGGSVQAPVVVAAALRPAQAPAAAHAVRHPATPAGSHAYVETVPWEIRQYANVVGLLIAQRFPRTWELFEEGRAA